MIGLNALVLAYAGASLPFRVLLVAADPSVSDVVNGEVIAVEMVRSVIGSIGLIASVPLTTALGAAVVRHSTSDAWESASSVG